MNFKDMWATNEDGKEFLFTIEMQRRLHQAGLPIEPASLADLETQKSDHQQPRRDVEPRKTEKEESRRDRNEYRAEKETFDEPADIQIDSETGKYIGRLKWYNESKGYGFIARGGGEQIFFHKSNVDCELSDLIDGVWVLYDVEETQKGFEAHDVEVKE
jgi:CspA family cold shock protein